jgi:hypothetical protein
MAPASPGTTLSSAGPILLLGSTPCVKALFFFPPPGFAPTGFFPHYLIFISGSVCTGFLRLPNAPCEHESLTQPHIWRPPAPTRNPHPVRPLSLPVALRPPVLHWGLRTALLGMLLVLASGSRRCAPCLRCPPTLCTVFPPIPFSLLDVLNSGNCVSPGFYFLLLFSSRRIGLPTAHRRRTLRRRPAPASGGRVVLRTRVLRAPSKPLLHSPHTVECCVPNYVPPPFFLCFILPPSLSLSWLLMACVDSAFHHQLQSSLPRTFSLSFLPTRSTSGLPLRLL